MNKQVNQFRDPATLHNEKQHSLTNGVRKFILCIPADAAPDDLSQVAMFEAFNCEAYHEVDAMYGGQWFEMSNEGDTRHSHWRWVDDQKVFETVLACVPVADKE